MESFKENLELSQTIYNDETRMRKIITDQLGPLFIIAKENMLTNAMKNNEIIQTKEDVRDLSNDVTKFRTELEIIYNYE
jgi:hypothetical protein